jgi:anti-sigma B factor antagonist
MEERRVPDLDGGSSELTILHARIGHRLVLAAEGEVDLASADELRAALAAAAADSGAAEVWLDLSGLAFMDSTGITAIVDARSAFDGRRFALICPDGPVKRVLDIAGIARAIPIHPSRAEAHSAP